MINNSFYHLDGYLSEKQLGRWKILTSHVLKKKKKNICMFIKVAAEI